MRIITKAAELARTGTATRAAVMTMGALHEGHLALVRAARETADEVVVTVFVNPLQFNDPADLERYPRDLEADRNLLEPLGVDVLFAPSADEVYPGGRPVVTVSAGRIGEIYEGEYRPGHFDGVLTVVLKLMNLTRPDAAFFGAKDAQQLIAIRRMVSDLNVGVEIVGVPTVREADGLALSSRNVFLSPAEREDALSLSRALRTASDAVASGASLPDVVAAGRAVLDPVRSVRVEYLAVLDPASAEGVGGDYRGEAVIAVAAHVGATRLIDNMTTVIGGSS
jgi:pantoate--beta-alanine ligase